MEIKVCTKISKQYRDIEVQINAPERNEQVQQIENSLMNCSNKSIEKVVGIRENDFFIIEVKDIIKFYSEGKNNYCKTTDGFYRIREKIYYLEENLNNNNFIRISNSVIINMEYVKCFNTTVIGKIVVKFKDGSLENVSQRRISTIMKLLKNRGE